MARSDSWVEKLARQIYKARYPKAKSFNKLSELQKALWYREARETGSTMP